MKATIDAAGRRVVPIAPREALGFRPGQELEASVRDGCLEVAAVPARWNWKRLMVVVGDAVPNRPMPPLGAVVENELC